MRPRHAPGQLTKTETAVLVLLWDGLATWEVANQLGCSKRTVDFHIANIFTKWKVSCRVQMIKVALTRGVLSAPSKQAVSTQRFDKINQGSPLD